jgi:hypothetical protein
MSMKELNESTARMGLTDVEMNGGRFSIPVVCGSWKKNICKDDDEGGFVTTKRSSTLSKCFLTLESHSSNVNKSGLARII